MKELYNAFKEREETENPSEENKDMDIYIDKDGDIHRHTQDNIIQ
jgi:hypothetical protein